MTTSAAMMTEKNSMIALKMPHKNPMLQYSHAA